MTQDQKRDVRRWWISPKLADVFFAKPVEPLDEMVQVIEASVFDAAEAERDALKAKLEIAVEALDKIEYHWHVTEHCELAREALTKIRGE